ncbi:MAG: hypothetical protein JWN48_3708 [Myxococcaceae bacterium]|nr:hypothetical protein [Myxococcaceae bacterium]
MRIDLGQLSATDLHLELPGAEANQPARELAVSSAESLRGVLSSQAEGFELSDVTAARLLLAKLHWRFGGLTLSTDHDAALIALRAQVSSRAEDTEVSLELGQLDAEQLQIATPSLRLTAQIEGRALRLQSSPSVGVLSVEQAVFHNFELQTGALTVHIPELKVTQLVADWSGAEFRLEAGTADASALLVTLDGVRLEGSGVTVAALRMIGAQVRVGSLRAGRFSLAGELARAAAPSTRESGSTAASSAPSASAKSALSFDYALLDGLAGRLDVDVALDVAVPIIGHRRATHELRIAIDHGALNYRHLEHNLAPLEDSLIDFSVRDGALVLERGLPLISTRGRGKPILIWDLSAADLALAEQQRVRLAVLPTFHLAGQDGSEPPAPREEGSNGGGLKLRHLSFENIEAALRLPQGPSGASGLLRDLTFANLTVSGTVHHDPDGPARDGALDLMLEGLRASLGELALGTQKLRGRVELSWLREVHVDFTDLRPTQVRAIAEGVTLTDLELS